MLSLVLSVRSAPTTSLVSFLLALLTHHVFVYGQVAERLSFHNLFPNFPTLMLSYTSDVENGEYIMIWIFVSRRALERFVEIVLILFFSL